MKQTREFKLKVSSVSVFSIHGKRSLCRINSSLR